MTPFQLIQLRTTLAFTGLCLWLGVGKPHLLRISMKDIIYFLPLGTLGVAAAQFLYLFAISKINVAAAILLHYTGPVFVALYSVIVARERLTPLTIAAIMGSLVVAEIVPLNDGSDRTSLRDSILDHCRTQLDRHKVPALINFVKELPCSATGKLARDHE